MSHSFMLDTFPFIQFIQFCFSSIALPRVPKKRYPRLWDSLSQSKTPCPILLSCAQTDAILHGQLPTSSWGIEKVAAEDRDTQKKNHAFFNANSVAKADTILQFVNLWYGYWDHSTIRKWKIATILITKETISSNNVMFILRKVKDFEGKGLKDIKLSHP